MIRAFRAALSVLVAAGFAVPAHAQVTVKDPWVRATVSQQRTAGAFMQITSVQDVRLVEVRSPVAAVVEIHEMKMDKDVMKMRVLPNGLDLPAGKTVELKSGGYHIMLIDLKQAVKEGAIVPMVLVIEGRDRKRTMVEVQAVVKPLTSGGHLGGMDHSKH